MAVEGTLDLFKLPEILQLISQQKKTGILTVQGQQDIIAISFLGGQIVAADALSQTVEEGLSQVLVKEGLISAADFSRATSEHHAAGGRLLDLLVERRYVPRPQLLQALRIQTYRQLEQLLSWQQGDFKFYSGDEVSYEEGFVPISVDEFLVNSLPAVRAASAAAASAAGVAAGAVAAAARPAQPAPVASAASMAAAPGLRVVRGGAEPARPATSPAPMSPGSLAAPAVPGNLGKGTAGEAATTPFRKMTVEASATVPASARILPPLLATVLAALLVAVLLLAPHALLLPYPWHDAERAALTQEQRIAQYRKIDRAAKTFFLLEGRFPEQLNLLRDSGLLARRDLRDPLGYPFQYVTTDESYILQPLDQNRPLPGTESTEAITGNFLLDPELVSVTPESTRAPLVLLD